MISKRRLECQRKILLRGCDPALLKLESEALPPPHETIPIEPWKCEFEG
jgi:hypothetical protein